ncbi:MAG: glycosyltransferase family 4 protein [Anaerolineales bacterium]|nr:glycosyltransferase family 4 protein [Anaerolineales bacterium]
MTKKVHVVMIIQDYLSNVGGAQGQLASISPFLQALDVDVSVITRQYPGLAAQEIVDDVNIYRSPSPGSPGFASAISTLLALPVLARIQPDIIHVHGLLSPMTTGLAGKKITGVPLVVKVLRGGDLGDLNRLHTKIFSAARINWMRQMVDLFFVISDEIDQELDCLGISGEKRIIMPNGVDTNKFSPVSDTEKKNIRKSLGLSEDGLIGIYSGRLVAEKQVNKLLTVFRELKLKYPNAYLMILGSGPQENSLKKISGPGVKFVGFTDQVDSYLKAADIFVLPSATEGLSNSMLEAMAAGLAVVATAVGGAPDVIEHKYHGWLVDPDETESLKNALEVLLEDDELRKKLGTNARKKMEDEYAFAVIAKRMREMYDRLLNNRHAEMMN